MGMEQEKQRFEEAIIVMADWPEEKFEKPFGNQEIDFAWNVWLAAIGQQQGLKEKKDEQA